MKVIPVKRIADELHPSEPITETAVRIVCDGENYTVYEPGDELPPEPAQMTA